MSVSRTRTRTSQSRKSPESIKTETNPMRSNTGRSETPKIDLMETKTMKFYKLLELKKENIDFSQFEEEYKNYVNKIKDENPDETKRKTLTETKTKKFNDYYFYGHIWVTAEDKQTNIDEAIKLRATVLIRIYSYPDGLQPQSKIEFIRKCNENGMKYCEPSTGIKSIKKGVSKRFSRRFGFDVKNGGQRKTKQKTKTVNRKTKKQNESKNLK